MIELGRREGRAPVIYVAGVGLPCRHGCGDFIAHPKAIHRRGKLRPAEIFQRERTALLVAIAERNDHELDVHGAVFDPSVSALLRGARRASRIGDAL